MIPQLLEKAILKGWATYSKWTLAHGMFGEFKVPKGKIVIVVDLKWNNFINPFQNSGAITIENFFKYNEYQIKIDGRKSINKLTFRNVVSFVSLNNRTDHQLNRSNRIDEVAFYNEKILIPAPPVLQDVYFICEEYLKLTVSRNAYFNTLASTYGLMAPPANEKNAPNGVKNIKLLKRLQMTTAGANVQFYTPPSNADSGLTIPAGGRNYESYAHDIEPPGVFGNSDSEIFPPDTGFTATLDAPTVTQPLVELGLVIINSDAFDQLANT